MNRATLLALFASAISEPWAVRREWMDALGAAAVALGNSANIADMTSRGQVGAEIAPPAIEYVRTVALASIRTRTRADVEDDGDDDDVIDDVDAEDSSCEDAEDEEACDADPAEATEPGSEDDEEYHPDPNSAGGRAVRAATVHPNTARAVAKKSGAVAVIPINGAISPRGSIFDWIFGTTPCTPANIAKAVTDASNDEAVKAIVLNIDSGGGNTVGITECFRAILAVRGKKPIVAQVSGLCCSAAYWLAAACDEITATESATVGSLGVFMALDDVTAALEKLGVKRTYVQGGVFKTEIQGDAEPISDEAKAHLQEYVDDIMSQFMADVAQGRGVSPATVAGESYGQGRFFMAARALKRGMIDRVRALEDTLGMFGVSLNDAAPNARKGRSVALLRREVEALNL